MSIYLAKTYKKLASGKRLLYFVLRANIWDYVEKRQKTKYLAYLGRQPKLTGKRARELAKRLGCTLSDLRRVKGLKITERDGA